MSRRNKNKPNNAVATTDAFSNPLFRLGYGSQSPLEATEYPLTRMTDNYALLNSLYRDNWVVQNVVDLMVDDMLREWYKLRGVGPEYMDELEKVERITKIKERLKTGLSWGRLYGGAAGLILIKGQEGMLDQPLDLEMVIPILQHTHTTPEGTTGSALDSIACIENGQALPVENGYIILNRALEVGDKVLMMKVQHGQKFVVLSRVF